jgi:hypothetical protein
MTLVNILTHSYIFRRRAAGNVPQEIQIRSEKKLNWDSRVLGLGLLSCLARGRLLSPTVLAEGQKAMPNALTSPAGLE